MSSTRAMLVVLFAVGAFSQMAQALLARELLVTFMGNEISLGIFYGSWLGWIGVGGVGAAWWHRRRPGLSARGWVRGCLLALPAVLALQWLALRGARLWISAPVGGILPLGDLMGVAALVVLPSGVLVGALFPLAGEALAVGDRAAGSPPTSGFARLFSAEALGAMLGGVAFTLLLVERFSSFRLLGLAMALPWLAALPLTGGGRGRGGVVLAVVSALSLAVGAGAGLERSLEQWRMNALLPGMTLLESTETRYGHVALVGLGNQRTVVEDGRVGESFPNPEASRLEAAYYFTQGHAPRRILLLGGGMGGLAEALLAYPEVERLDVVLEDAAAFAMIRAHLPSSSRAALEDSRLSLHFGDGRAFVRTGPTDPFDLVLSLPGDPVSARQNRYFTREYFAFVARNLSPGGVFCTRVGSASNYLGREVKSYGGSLLATLREVWPHDALAPGDWLTLCASARSGVVTESAPELMGRYRAHPPRGEGIVPERLHGLLPPERVASTRARLEEEGGRVNRDRQPVSFLLNLMIWGKYTGSSMGAFLALLQRLGAWACLVPAGVMVWVLLLGRVDPHGAVERSRRQGAAWALGVLGFVAMAAQLLVLYAYQSAVGYVYGRIALLNALFMLGMALGSMGAGWHLGRGGGPLRLLSVALVVSGAYVLAFPQVLMVNFTRPFMGEESVYFLLALLAGAVTGAGFPPAVRLLHDGGARVSGAGGLAEAADHLGGALGGLLAGILLMPVLGWSGSGALLAILLGLALLPLWIGTMAVRLPRFWRVRMIPSFPPAGVGRLLGWGVVGLVMLALLARPEPSPPQSSFHDEVLAEVSGAKWFQRREEPFPHDLGRLEEGGGVTTVALATQPVAGEVRGYGGPINLLVAVDGEGILRGARWIESHETPSYIQGVEAWLAGLRGFDLSARPLELAHVEAMSGATVSSRAALESLRRAADKGSMAAFGRRLAAPVAGAAPPWWRQPDFMGVAGLLILLPLVHGWAGAGVRRLYLAATGLVCGVLGNTLLTELDLAHLLLGRLPAWEAHPAWFLLAVAAVLTTPLWGPLHCAWLCPFGAVQELVSRLGERLGLRQYPQPPWERRARLVKYLLLGLGVVGVAWSGENWPLAINPMQEIFSDRVSAGMVWLAGLALLAALFYFRFWCRYLCPMGACLHLGNKAALLESVAPGRRLNHCDLGVSHRYDVDCLRCQRCVHGSERKVEPSGTETGIMGLGRRRLGDGWLGFLLLLAMVGILQQWASGRETARDQGGGWRRIDAALVRQQVKGGRLSDREAAWYRPLEERETP